MIVKIVALYNVAVFFGLPIGFCISGLLLKKNLPTLILFYGNFLQAVTITLLIVLNKYLSDTTILIIGGIYGMSTGLYFANRHMLSIRATQNNNRIYFNSIDVTSSTFANMVIPILIGYFITFGTQLHFYTATQAYYYIAAFLVLGTFLLGLFIRKVSIRLPEVTRMVLHKPTKRWIKLRNIAFIVGLFFGPISFLPTLLILSFIGKEDALGTVQSFAAIITVIVLLIIGKRIKPQQKSLVLTISIFLTILGIVSFSISYSALGVLLLVGSQTLAQPLLAIAIGTFSYDTIEKESDKQFSYVLDNEVFTNLGRVTGIIILLLAFHWMEKDVTLKIIPLFFAITQIFLLFFVTSIEKKEQEEQVEHLLTTINNFTRS